MTQRSIWELDMRDNDKYRAGEVVSFDEMTQRAHQEGVSSTDKMALIVTTDMGYNHCYKSAADQHYVLSNDTDLITQAGIERLR